MPVRIVQSKQNARLKQLRRALAQPGRAAGELAALEGPHLLGEALRAGLHIDCVFAAHEREDLLADFPLPAGVEVLLIPQHILAPVLTTETPQPLAALVAPPTWTWQDLLAPVGRRAPLLLVLAALQDPGNLGTILRSAEAFGATGIVALPGTVSAWNPKAVRASAGSVLRMPFLSATPVELFAELHAAHVRLFTTALRDAESAHTAGLAAPSAILIGNEGNGVPADIAAHADAALTIPCPGPVESLNAAVAASILLYEASRQRATQGDPR